MGDDLSRIWQEIAARPDGPFAFRFYLQPVMATVLAIKDGVADGRLGKPPYFWTLFTKPPMRSALLHDGWRSVWKLFILAITLDVAYEFIVLKGPRPLETLIVAIGLAVVPYLTLRGIVSRVVRRRVGPPPPKRPDVSVHV